MCGVAGVLRPGNHELEPEMRRMAARIARRGPDGTGQVIDRNQQYSVGLAHSRLAIIDLSEFGRQPMSDPQSGWTIVYNGEIYNYVELRGELEAKGVTFVTSSDTEVLLKAWATWGADGLSRLNGMFAFAAYSARTHELWLVRDRFGVKPLFWSRLGGDSLAFCSSVAAVAEWAGASVDTSYCARGLRYQAFDLADDASPFSGVETVPAGGWIRIDCKDASARSGRWYDLERAVAAVSDRIASLPDRSLLEECSQTLQDAVRLRLRSDVPVAVSLSGGLDSSTIAAFASRRVEHLRGFSYGEASAARSEGPVVAAFSKETGIATHFIWPEHGPQQLDSLLETTLGCQEAPFSGLSVLAQNEVYRTVREQGFKVLLGGQGGDEAFAGYRKFFIVALREALTRRDAFDAIRLCWSLGLMLIHEVSQAKVYWNALDRYRRKPGHAFGLLNWVAPELNLWGRDSTLTSRQIEDVQRWSIPTLLRYEDRNSMGHSVESRLPFMDFRLLELALALPARMKISNGFGKWSLREVAEGAVPDVIRLCRKKRGFDVTQDWIGAGVGASLRARIGAHQSTLAAHLRRPLDVGADLADELLRANPNLLDEALMLAWLSDPTRQVPATVGKEAA